jgi:hypothetical protein
VWADILSSVIGSAASIEPEQLAAIPDRTSFLGGTVVKMLDKLWDELTSRFLFETDKEKYFYSKNFKNFFFLIKSYLKLEWIHNSEAASFRKLFFVF